MGMPFWYLISHPSQLILAAYPLVAAVRQVMVTATAREKHKVFMSVGPVTKAVGILI